ncbi:methyltransferase domain-containing protein [Synechococcus sp. CB0205]|uniref:class I SAM-dependent methyltransferase n=1 Tax=Synechococcus sp. CB0205 TaxID=232363 RepID=UPI00049500F6|nr:methyltransferase domain-containing protein [Synechococcus sp. CB0205]
MGYKLLSQGTFLHVGCGHKRADQTPFAQHEWREIRMDIDAAVSPDVLGTMTDMSSIESESVDAVFSSHNIEHLYPHEVPQALSEFLRVLRTGGFALITCPDLRSVCRLIADDRLTEAAYTSPAGPIAPLDILYGHRASMAAGNLYMAHRCGFTEKVLAGTLQAAGFQQVASLTRPQAFDLWVFATKETWSDEALQRAARELIGR